MFEFGIMMILPAALAFAGAMDLLTMTIPNRISIALLAGFCLAAPLAGLSLQEFGLHLAAGALILGVGIILFSFGLFGGGDAKLMAAASVWIGFEHLLTFFVDIALLGGVLAVIILLYRRLPVAIFPTQQWAWRLHSADVGMPYGLAIAGAGLFLYPKTEIFRALVA